MSDAPFPEKPPGQQPYLLVEDEPRQIYTSKLWLTQGGGL